jgi:signal transduction histidine kinase
MNLEASIFACCAAALGYGLAHLQARRRAAKLELTSDFGVNAMQALRRQLDVQQQEHSILKRDLSRYANIINATLNPIWVRDESLKITYCNLAFTEVAEETAESVVAIGEVELFKGHTLFANKAWEQGKELFERRHIVVGGERRLYMIREVPFKKEGCMIGYAVNISELEEAQEEIQRHISALRDLLESSTSAMAIYGKDTRLKFYNYAFVSLWKLDEHWLDTEPTYGEVLEALREKRKLPEQANFQAFKAAQQKLFTTLIDTEESFFYLPDGKTLRTIAIPHALGGILFVYEDVTDKLALERSYNTLIAVQRETLDHLHEGIAVFTENGRLSLCNPTFKKLWRLADEFNLSEPHIRDVLEKCQSLFQVEDWELFKQNLVQRLLQRQFFAIRFERTDETVIDCSIVPLPDGATLMSFIDMTDSTLVERSLREKNEALEAADKLKTEFLANMSYELRSPLTSISGFSEMLSRHYLGPLNSQQQEYVESIFQSSQQLGQLISDIIDLATIEAGYLRLDVTEFAVADVLEHTHSLIGERLKLAELTLTTEIASNLTRMRADETRVKQILFNLLSNAIKYTRPQGSIQLRMHVPQQGILELVVQDNGMGIDAAKKAHVFDPFFRGGSGQGSPGLGLSMVKRFVQLHGGTVTLESELGVGTTVTCRFPQPPALAQMALADNA